MESNDSSEIPDRGGRHRRSPASLRKFKTQDLILLRQTLATVCTTRFTSSHRFILTVWASPDNSSGILCGIVEQFSRFLCVWSRLTVQPASERHRLTIHAASIRYVVGAHNKTAQARLLKSAVLLCVGSGIQLLSL